MVGIPRPQSSRSRSHTRFATKQDPSTIHQALAALDAPYISSDDFTRLYHGRLAEVLQFIAEHVRGRLTVAKARKCIQSAREDRQNSQIKCPDDIVSSAIVKGTRSLVAANKALAVTKFQLSELQDTLNTSQIEENVLKRKLNERIRVALLLEVLAKKESIRKERHEELRIMMDKLRTAVVGSRLEPPSTLHNPTARTPFPRISQTQRILADLCVYHTRLATLAVKEGKSMDTSANCLGTLIEDHDLLKRCEAIARQRARRRVRYQSSLSEGRNISQNELENKLASIKVREDDVKKLIEHLVKLNITSRDSLNSISIFQNTTSHVLRTALENEMSSIRSYVDVLRLMIASSVIPEHVQQSPVQSVLSIRGSINSDGIVSHIENLLQRSNQEKLIFSIWKLRKPFPPADQDNLVTEYQENLKNVNDRLVRLLTRKVEKAEMGFSLAKDIEALINEIRYITTGKSE